MHALIVGEQGVGKSTLIARVRKELGLREAGVETVREVSMTEERGAPVFLYRVGSPRTKGPDNLAAYVKPGGKTSFPQVFDRSAPLLKQDAGDAELIVLENIGNLVCPAEFDTGAAINMTILSVPEGDDKPAKYPLMYETCDMLVVNKIDTLPVFDFDRERMEGYARARNPEIEIYYISAKTGEGVQELADALVKKVKEWNAN